MKRLLDITIVACLVIIAGCSAPYIDTTYGRRSGVSGGKSVNGTAVLSDMFEQAGHKVYSWRWLSPKLDQADVIVWAPDNYKPPNDEVRKWLDQWLLNYPHTADGVSLEENCSRTLVYIGRDFDAGPMYWKKVQPGAPAKQQAEIGRRIVAARGHENTLRADLPKTADNDWFHLDSTSKSRQVRTLSGPWSESIDPTKVEIELRTRIEPALPENSDSSDDESKSPFVNVEREDDEERSEFAADSPGQVNESTRGLINENLDEAYEEYMVESNLDEYDDSLLPEPTPDTVTTEALLSSGGDTLVSSRYWADDYGDEGTLIIVSNGSFLLNLPLVNHEHRKLAGKLVDAVGPAGQKVVFLEPPGGDPEILESDPEASVPTGLEMFNVWPINYVLLHAALLGVIFCFARSPIFGLARDPRRPALADFGKHVAALGELLQKTRNRGYAASRVRQYHQVVLGETASDDVEPDDLGVDSNTKARAETKTEPGATDS